MSLETLQAARTQIELAQKTLKDEARDTIKDEIVQLFTDPEVLTITWAQKAGEYNDEGMYPGVFGPALNLDGADQEDLDIRDFAHEAGYDFLYSAYDLKIDPRAKRLHDVLNAVGEDVLSNLYGEENIVIVQRTEKGARVLTEYVGY